MVVDYPEHISLEEAWELLRAAFQTGAADRAVELKISDSLGHALARDLTAARNVPHYAASAVDGYALDAASTIGAAPATPVRFAPERCAWVNTGADIPDWSNCVLMVEDSSLDGDTLIVNKSLTPSANVRPVGEDVMAGQIIAREGDVVTPALVSLFLCAGLETVPVSRKPKALFIPTGDEIVAGDKWLADSRQKSGTVAESNSLFIKASFEKWGYELDVSPILPDKAEILKKASWTG